MSVETGVILLKIIFFIAGAVSIAASVMNWDGFFNMNQVKALIPGKHRTAARLIYGFLGAAFIAVSFY
jgi:hypothetical protein